MLQMMMINNKNDINTFSHNTHKSTSTLECEKKKLKFHQNSILFKYFFDSFFMRINQRKTEKDDKKTVIEQIN